MPRRLAVASAAVVSAVVASASPPPFPPPPYRRLAAPPLPSPPPPSPPRRRCLRPPLALRRLAAATSASPPHGACAAHAVAASHYIVSRRRPPRPRLSIASPEPVRSPEPMRPPNHMRSLEPAADEQPTDRPAERPTGRRSTRRGAAVPSVRRASGSPPVVGRPPAPRRLRRRRRPTPSRPPAERPTAPSPARTASCGEVAGVEEWAEDRDGAKIRPPCVHRFSLLDDPDPPKLHIHQGLQRGAFPLRMTAGVRTQALIRATRDDSPRARHRDIGRDNAPLLPPWRELSGTRARHYTPSTRSPTRTPSSPCCASGIGIHSVPDTFLSSMRPSVGPAVVAIPLDSPL